MNRSTQQAHRERVDRIARTMAGSDGPVRLRKSTSNLFRPRRALDRVELDVSDLNHVLCVNPQAGTADVEGMTTYARLVDATLPHGLAPAIVPELKSITVGGATTGVGIESSAFRYGLVHDTAREIDVIGPDGRVRTCSPDRRSDLFHAFPNSYGSLGYATRVRIDLIPVTPYIRLEHVSFEDPERLFAAIERECEHPTCAYLEAVCFGPAELVLTRAYWCEALPAGVRVGDYTWMRQYWKSLREHREDYLSILDYLWRWDTDWFWCSRNVGAHLAPLRLLLGPRGLSSVTYQRIMRASHRWPLNLIQRFQAPSESVIQDVDIPIANASAFLADFEDAIGIHPVWLCPFVVPNARFPLFRLRPDTAYINFGFWDRVPSDQPDGYFNELVERLVARHGGKKSLYSRSTYDEQSFWAEYDRDSYHSVKTRIDPNGRFPGLYEKAVGRG